MTIKNVIFYLQNMTVQQLSYYTAKNDDFK